MYALKLDQVVVSAAFRGGKLVTDGRPGMVNPTLARDWIQKLTGLTKNRIRLPTQDALVVINASEPLFSDLITNGKMFREPADVAFCYLHAVIDRTTVSRTLRAVVRRRSGTSRRVTHVRLSFLVYSTTQRRPDFLYSAISDSMNSSRRS